MALASAALIGAVLLCGNPSDGSGSGSGSGSGYGYGDGYDSGYGDGYGYGYGYGDGSGSGDGDGDGSDPTYWRAVLAKLPESQLAISNGATQIAFWKSDSRGAPSNGGSDMTAAIGLVQELPGPVPAQCGRGAFHATLDPSKWNGERLWVVALYGEVRHESDKCWAMKREFLAEITSWSRK